MQRLNPVVSKLLGVVLCVHGEPGIGKTWTMTQVLKGVPCRHLSLHATISESKLASMLPRPKNLPAWAEKQLLRLEAGEFVDAGTLVNTLATTLAGLAPFILHLEDAHEASPERMALLQKLGQVVPRNRGVGLIVSSRSPLPEPFQTFRLEVLSQAESGALLISEMGTALPSQALDYIYARAQGNPLFTLEFLRYLRRQGFLWSDGHHWQWRPPPEGFVPVSLEAIISHLISSANTPELKTILQARTMLPVNLETDSVVATWAQVAGLSLEAFVQPYEFLEQQGIFVRHDFTHPLIGELVKREITPAERQATAQRAFGTFASRLELAVLYVQEAAVDKPQAFELIQQLIATARAQNNKRQETELLSVACAYCPAEQVLEFNLEAAGMSQSLPIKLETWVFA